MENESVKAYLEGKPIELTESLCDMIGMRREVLEDILIQSGVLSLGKYVTLYFSSTTSCPPVYWNLF